MNGRANGRKIDLLAPRRKIFASAQLCAPFFVAKVIDPTLKNKQV